MLFAVSTSMDGLLIGLSYGVKKIHIPFISNIVIGSIAFLGTLISMLIGKSLLDIVPQTLAGILGGIVIIAIGCYCLVKFIYEKIKNNINCEKEKIFQYDKDKSGIIDLKESLALGFALSLNNMAIGVSTGAAGLNIIAASIASFLLSIIFIYVSNFLGKSFLSKFFGKYTEPIAGLLIIALGIYEILS